MRFNLEPARDITGFDAVGFDLSGIWTVPSDETIHAELYIFSGGSGTITAIDVEGSKNYTEVASEVGEISAQGAVNLNISIESTGGQTVEIRTPTMTMYGRVA
ncbi:hypothetical protein [Halococcus sp. IIIV-5B]|uniref:hypothetical protein n=1 Tax=Halococcus sp. IIIV-5B TaxID=2321230 RepID=UPI000E707333|nr:hypothetical protein [Halococcus sp. IIIV-5B]RJT08000.1 hypothetical protein D3261_01260 [Halococcus sp. IIIV-5B]